MGLCLKQKQYPIGYCFFVTCQVLIKETLKLPTNEKWQLVQTLLSAIQEDTMSPHSRCDNDPRNCTVYRLNPGDLIEFNCKHLQACIQAEPGRIGLIMWQLKPSYHRLAVTSSYL